MEIAHERSPKAKEDKKKGDDYEARKKELHDSKAHRKMLKKKPSI